jgi:hypothetical protein
MRKLVLFVLVLLTAGSISAFAQHYVEGPDISGTMGLGLGLGPDSLQKPLSKSEIKSGAFHMLEQETGMSQPDLQKLYTSSGARYFQEFASAMLVSKHLGLNYQQVLLGLKKKSLRQTIQKLGVSHDIAKAEIRKARHEVKAANKGGRLG